MSIRMLAKELYRLHQEVEKLEKDVKAAPAEKREALKDRLRQTKAEMERIRRALEGRKESPVYRKTFGNAEK